MLTAFLTNPIILIPLMFSGVVAALIVSRFARTLAIFGFAAWVAWILWS